jgi:hypothetical protein
MHATGAASNTNTAATHLCLLAHGIEVIALLVVREAVGPHLVDVRKELQAAAAEGVQAQQG